MAPPTSRCVHHSSMIIVMLTFLQVFSDEHYDVDALDVGDSEVYDDAELDAREYDEVEVRLSRNVS